MKYNHSYFLNGHSSSWESILIILFGILINEMQLFKKDMRKRLDNIDHIIEKHNDNFKNEYKKENIQEFLKSQDIEESKYYYGGGDFGFVGIKDRVFSEDEIKNILEKMLFNI